MNGEKASFQAGEKTTCPRRNGRIESGMNVRKGAQDGQIW